MAQTKTLGNLQENQNIEDNYKGIKRSYLLNGLHTLRDELAYYNDPNKNLSEGLIGELSRKINRMARKLFKEINDKEAFKNFKNANYKNVFEKFDELSFQIEERIENLEYAEFDGLDEKSKAKKYKKSIIYFSKTEYKLTNKNKFNRRIAIKDNILGYSFVSPALLIVGLFTLYSIGFALFASLNVLKLKGAGLAWDFVGFDQYQKVISNPVFLKSLKTSIMYMVMVAPIQTVIALVLSTVLSSKLKGSKWFMIIYFLPTLTSSTALTMIFVRLFGHGGPMSSILGNDFTAKHILGLIAIMNIWSTVPMFMTTFNAAHSEVPKSLYEAAEIDGANPVKKFMLVTVPQLRPVISYVLLMGVIGTLQMFDQAFIIAKDKTIGADPNALITTSKYIFDVSFGKIGQDWGYASAAAVVFAAIILAFSLLASFISKGDKRS